jgi:hypothetical protein
MIEAAVDDPIHAATIRAILSLARELGIGVITEGVETEEQHGRSRATSAVAQGFYFSAAVNVEAAQKLLRRGSIDVRSGGAAALTSPPPGHVVALSTGAAPGLPDSDQLPPSATPAPGAENVRKRANK